MKKGKARDRQVARRAHRFAKAHLLGGARPAKGQPGLQPRMKHGETEMRVVRTLTRHVQRKLKQGRPGRPNNAPPPDFDWEKVVNNSQRRRLRLTKTRKNYWGRITRGGLS